MEFATDQNHWLPNFLAHFLGNLVENRNYHITPWEPLAFATDGGIHGIRSFAKDLSFHECKFEQLSRTGMPLNFSSNSLPIGLSHFLVHLIVFLKKRKKNGAVKEGLLP